MSREAEDVTFLLADATLLALVPGGVYSDRKLTDSGITNARATPKVWTGGVFNACLVVRGRADVPQFRVYDAPSRTVDVVQVLEHYIYARSEAAIASIASRLYTLLQEHRFSGAYGAQWQPGLVLMDAPNLIGVQMQRDDYRITSLRTPA